MSGRNRAHVKARIRDVATWIYRDENITVTYGLDTEPDNDATFHLGPAEGTSDPESTDGAAYTDLYVIKAAIEVHGETTDEAGEIETERLLAIFEDQIGAHSRLSHPDVPGDPDLYQGITTPYVSTVNGPRSDLNGVAWVEFDIACMAHILRST